MEEGERPPALTIREDRWPGSIPHLIVGGLEDAGEEVEMEDDGYNPALNLIEEQITLAEKFCLCRNMDNCRCGENGEDLDWCFDETSMTAACQLSKEATEVLFHPRFSVGTACVRADRPLRHGYQHYFELKVLTPCFGTDIMIGIGTEKANMSKYERRFASLLGCCSETWGLSYKGPVYHNEQWTDYHTGFGQASIVGVHVDLWRGRVSYHINRKLIGVAFVNLRNSTAEYYPMICSTAAKSRFRLIAARSYATNLQYFCCDAFRQVVPHGERYLSGVGLPPALKLYLENNLNWLLIGTAPPWRFKSRKDQQSRKRNSIDTTSGHSPSSSSSSAMTSPSSTSTASEQPTRGAARLAHFAHRLALIPMITLQIDDHRRVDGPSSAPVLPIGEGTEARPGEGEETNPGEGTSTDEYDGPVPKKWKQ